MNITGTIHKIFRKSNDAIEHEIRYWRNKICDSLFKFFSLFGFFTLIPSVYLSLRQGYYFIAAISILLYLFCLFMTFSRRVGYLSKAVSGSVLFYLVGIALFLILGPRGAGEVWLFASTVLVALLLGNSGAIIVFAINTLTQILFFLMLRTGVLHWYDKYAISSSEWAAKSINFILVNFAILVGIVILIEGFKTLNSRSIETRNASIIGLAKLAEHRDGDTGNHLKRIQQYSRLLAKALTRLPGYKQYITYEYIDDLYISSILHDIGKVGIQDNILLKTGPLDRDEFEKIKQHPEIGGNVIDEIEKNISSQSLYTLGKEIALFHHEKWDGSGYPRGLKGEEIPLSSRIVALVDVYDALTTKRPYKEAIPHDEAVQIIVSGRGTQFDPDIVDTFLDIASEFRELSEMA